MFTQFTGVCWFLLIQQKVFYFILKQFSKMDLKLQFIVLFLVTCYTWKPAEGYVCSTPEDWLAQGDISTHYGVDGSTANRKEIRKWPGGVIKYYLNSSLSEQDKTTVFAAFEEYHSKTCIRFEPKEDGDLNYVSIEVDNNIGGMAHVCMQGGYQFAKFGKDCRNKNNMIHQLGHTLCLSHEEDRHEGDRFITYDKSCSRQSYSSQRIYDQASQMHYECDENNQCGYQITSGLSFLDADYINAMYNCQGCYRHRWIPKPLITQEDVKSMHSFGYIDLGSRAMYPCRAYFKGDVSIGKYNRDENTCYIGHGNKEYKLCEQFEVLTIPGSVRNNDTEYLIAAAYLGMGKNYQDNLFKHAVVGGRLAWADGSGVGNGYIAYGTIPNFQKSCDYDTMWWSGGENRKMDVIGRAWRYENRTEAFAALCKLEFRLKVYYILTCEKQKNNTEPTSAETVDDTNWGEIVNDTWLVQDLETPAMSFGIHSRYNRSTMPLRQENSNEASNNFGSGFATGFFVFVLLGILVGGMVYLNVVKKVPFTRTPVSYMRDRFLEEHI